MDVFLLNLRCSLERTDLRRFSGHMLCDACCMHLLDDNEKCKKVMMVDGFPVCFSYQLLPKLAKCHQPATRV